MVTGGFAHGLVVIHGHPESQRQGMASPDPARPCSAQGSRCSFIHPGVRMADQKQDMPKITVLYFVLKKTNSKFGFPSRGPHSSCHSPPLLKSWLQSSCFWSTWGLSRWVLRSGHRLCLAHLASDPAFSVRWGRSRSHLPAEHPHAEQLGQESTVHLP